MIEVKNLSKDYKIKHKEPGLKGAVKGLFKPGFETVHAVNDLSFRIGEVGHSDTYKVKRIN